MRVARWFFFIAVVLLLSQLTGPALADLLTPEQIYMDPGSLAYSEYPYEELLDLASVHTSHYGSGNVTGAEVLPPLKYNPAYSTAGYSFSQNDYFLTPGTDYTADLTGGNLTLDFHAAGLYHVRLHYADGSEEIRAIYAEVGELADGVTPGSGAVMYVPPPDADLVAVSIGDSTLDSCFNACNHHDPWSVTSISDRQSAIDAIKAKSDKLGRKIHVELVGHGDPGRISLYDRSTAAGDIIDNSSAASFQQAIDKYVNNISFYSCKTAKGTAGDQFLTTFASSVGRASGFTVKIMIASGTGLSGDYSSGYFAAGLGEYKVITTYGIPELYKVSVSGTPPIPLAPAFINYTLNCTANITVEIYPCDSAGAITGAKIRTAGPTSMAKGPHTFLWPCTKDDGSPASVGYYCAKIIASASPTAFSKIIGTFKADQNLTEYAFWNPTPMADVWGYYGVSINTNPASAYYGRVYAPNTNYQDIYMWDCDGTYLGAVDDSGIGWGGSAPWDTYVAADGYVYVGDQTMTRIYVFAPDGSKVGTGPITSNGQGDCSRSVMVRQYDSDADGSLADEYTHIFHCSGAVISHSTCSPDHLTWTPPTEVCDPPDTCWGVWASPDCSYLYVCQGGGAETGGSVVKWNKGSGWTYTQDSTWSCPITLASDACESPDGDYLWIGRFVSASSSGICKFWKNTGWSTTASWAASTAYTKGQVVQPTTPNSHKYVCIVAGTSGSTEPTWPTAESALVTEGTVAWEEASPIYYNNTVAYCKGVQSDAVGNVLMTYGTSASSWPSYYWALASPGGTYTATRQTGPFEVFSDSAPVVVPGSATWTYSDVSGKLLPDDTSTAKVDFKVLDANGYTDIGDVKVNPSSLRMQSDNGTLVDVDSKIQDTSDTNNLTALCRATFKAVAGTKAGVHTDLILEPRDLDYPTVASNADTVSVDVMGNDFTGTVKHLSHLALISGATMTIIGGTDGVYGYPFTYTTGLTDDNGQATGNISEGCFTVIATKTGYKTQSPSSFCITGYGGGTARDVWLGPITIAEAKALPLGTEASVAGVCYAQPKGLAPTAAYGLDYRVHSVLDTTSFMYNQWYMCDAGDPNSGMLFHLKLTSSTNVYTWDDPSAEDDFGVSLYIGARPAEGRVIWVKGEVQYISGYEKRLTVKDTDFLAESGTYPQTYNQTYWNKEAGAVPSPAAKTVEQVYHPVTFVGIPSIWGTYATLANARVVKWWPDAGKIPENATYTVAAGEEAIDAIIVMDDAYNWCVITPQTLTSLGLWDGTPPKPALVDVGDIYTFTGAGGRHARGSVGCIRVRKSADIEKTTDNTPPTADNIGSIRGPAASGLNLEGIVTAKFSDRIYVESEDRSSGAPVIASAAAQAFVKVRDRVWFTGDTALLDGQKQITLSTPFNIVSSGNALPYLGIRNRDIGGHEYGVNDPGVTNGLGALNVGLLVKLHGILTYKDTATTPTYFYIWDGGNKTTSPVNDGNADSAWGIRINSTPTTAMTPWTSWIEVEGVVSVNQTAVTGSIITIPEIIPSVTPVILAASDFTTVNFPAGTILTGKNLIGVPHTPGDVGSGDSGGFFQAYDPVTVLSPDKVSEDWYMRAELIDGRILRWDAGTVSSKGFDMWSEPHGEFGGITLGDGYWVTADSAWTTCSYKARVQNIPQWISPASATKILIANPQNYNVELDPANLEPPQDPATGVQMSDGAQVLSFYQASQYGVGWILSTGLWWDNAAGSSRDTGVVEDWGYDTRLLAWHGYWFTWLQNYKSMIVP